jgi:hypothetical protein
MKKNLRKTGKYWCGIKYMRQGKAAEVVTIIKRKIGNLEAGGGK